MGECCWGSCFTVAKKAERENFPIVPENDTQTFHVKNLPKTLNNFILLNIYELMRE